MNQAERREAIKQILNARRSEKIENLAKMCIRDRAILVLQKKRGLVRSVDVARHMEVKKPSVCHAVATLRDGGFLTICLLYTS